MIQSRLMQYCDILKDNTFLGKAYLLVAKYFSRQAQTVLFKNKIMDFWDTTEVLLFCPATSCHQVINEIQNLKALSLEAVKNPSRHHKETKIIKIFVTDTIDITQTKRYSQLIKAIKHFSFFKAIRFGFFGFIKAGVAIVDIKNNKIITSLEAKPLSKSLVIY